VQLLIDAGAARDVQDVVSVGGCAEFACSPVLHAKLAQVTDIILTFTLLLSGWLYGANVGCLQRPHGRSDAIGGCRG
jgi:hypothetical protein